MQNSRRTFGPSVIGTSARLALALAIASTIPSVRALTISKASNTTTLNLAGSWAGGTAPGSGDIAQWDATVTAANTSTLGANLSWQGIAVTSPTGLQTVTFAAGQTLTLGSSGIDLFGATQNMTLMSAAVANTAGTLVIGANQTWNVANARTLTLFSTSNSANQSLSGSGNIQITTAGTGQVTMNVGDATSTGFSGGGNSGFSGNWTIGTGTTGSGKIVTLRNGTNAWGTGTITLNGGTIAQSQGNWAWANNIILQTGTSSTIDDANTSGNRTLKLYGVLSGDGNLTFAETGGGAHVVDGGFILTNSNTLSGTVTVNSGTVLRIGGTPGAVNTTTVGSAGDLGTATVVNNGTITLSRDNTWTFANNISGSGLLRIGLNTGSATHIVTVSGNNSHTGGTTLQSAVTLKIGSASALGTGTFTIAGNGIFDNATGGALSVANALTMSGGSPTFTGTDDMSLGGGVLISGANRSLTVTNVGKSLTLNGNITQDVAGRVLTKIGPGTLVLSGSANAYDGGTSISDGYLQFGASSLPATGAITPGSNGSLVADGPFTTVMGWLGSTRVAAGSTGAIAITGNSSEAIDFTGFSSLGLSTNAAAATFSGTIAGTTTYRFSGESGTSLTVAATLTGANGVTKSDNSTVILTGANDYTGVTRISGGVLAVDNIANGAAASAIGASPSNGANLLFDTGTLRYTGSGHTTDRGFSINAAGIATIESSGSGALVFNGAGGPLGFNGATGVRTLVLDGTNTATNQMSIVIGDNTGATSLTKNGAGTWQLGGANSYTGNTTINGGTLIATGGSAIGDTSNVVLANTAGVTLRLDASETIGGISGGGVTGGTVNVNGQTLNITPPAAHSDFNGELTGSGTIVKAGANQLRLGGITSVSGSSTFSGTHLINAGLVIFTSLGADDGMPNVTINGDATSGIVLGDVFAGGKLQIGALSGTGGKVRADWNPVAGQRTLNVTQTTDTTFAGTFEDSAGSRIVGLEKDGSGTLTLSGISTNAGTTTVDEGTLIVTGSLSGSAVTVNGGVLGGSGTVGAVTVNALGTIAPGTSPAFLNTGSTTFNGGTLAVEFNSATAGSGYDQLNVTGGVTLAADSPLTIALGFDPVDDVDIFTIVNNDLADAVSGSGLFSYAGNPLSQGELFTVGTQDFTISYTGGDGNDIVLAAVPEPASIAMLLGGLGFLTARRRRKN